MITSTKSTLNETTRGTFPSVDAFAVHIGVSRKSAYDGLRNGSIPSIRLGKRFIIPIAAIDEWLRTAGGNVAA